MKCVICNANEAKVIVKWFLSRGPDGEPKSQEGKICLPCGKELQKEYPQTVFTIEPL